MSSLKLEFFKPSKVLLIGAISTLVVGCGSGSISDLKEFVDSTYKNERPEIESLPPIEPYEEFLYSAEELPDPFNSENVLDRTSGQDGEEASADSGRRKEPLEKFAIKTLSLSGVLQFRGALSALFNTPEGNVVSARVGNYIGLKNGRIISIDSESQIVRVEERAVGAGGSYEKKIVVITGKSGEGAK